MTSRKAGPRAGERFVAFMATVIVLALMRADRARPERGRRAAPGRRWPASARWRSGNRRRTSRCASASSRISRRRSCSACPRPYRRHRTRACPAGSRRSRHRRSRTARTGLYSQYGYAGYDYTTYDVGCVSPLTHPASSFEDTIANGEFMIATSVIGASDALREKAWDPQSMWGWADPLVDKATKSLYAKVFTVFGAITLAVVGLYLMWRSRQADMSNAMTTAGGRSS